MKVTGYRVGLSLQGCRRQKCLQYVRYGAKFTMRFPAEMHYNCQQSFFSAQPSVQSDLISLLGC